LVGRDSRSAITQFAAYTTDAAERGRAAAYRRWRRIRATCCSRQPSRTLSAIGHPHCQKNLHV